MNESRFRRFSRRDFLGRRLVARSGITAWAIGQCRCRAATRDHKAQDNGRRSIVTCIAPLYAAQEQLLHDEGFTDVRYVEYPADTKNWPPRSSFRARPTSASRSHRPISFISTQTRRSSSWPAATLRSRRTGRRQPGQIDPRTERQDCSNTEAGMGRASFHLYVCSVRRPQPTERHQLGCHTSCRLRATSDERKIDACGRSPLCAGTAGEEDRSCTG